MSSYFENIVNDKDLLEEITKRAFDSVDKDHSGHIDSKELEKIMAQISNDMGAEPPTKEDVKEILKQLDEDSSGAIEFEEFINLVKNILTALVED